MDRDPSALSGRPTRPRLQHSCSEARGPIRRRSSASRHPAIGSGSRYQQTMSLRSGTNAASTIVKALAPKAFRARMRIVP